MKILIIEDNIELLQHIESSLKEEAYTVETASNYADADEKIALYNYDILIVDINLPDGSGLDIIKTIKNLNPATGVIVVSARDSLDNKIEGLDLGADDYITKPFAIAELLARIKSLIRRRNFSGDNTIVINNMTISPDKREVYVKEKLIDLTKSEYDILLFFISNQNRVISKESLAEHIWGDHMDLVDSFDFIYSHIKNLRKKLSVEGNNFDELKAVYGVGYKFEV